MAQMVKRLSAMQEAEDYDLKVLSNLKASVDTHAELHVHDFDLFLLFLRSEIVCL